MTGILWVSEPTSPEGWFSFASPSIWVVPGDDPYGKSGSEAIANSRNYVWATVGNLDLARSAIGAVVEFYYMQFSVAVGPALSPIGRSTVDLAPNNSDNVLCVTPFCPTTPGHGCLVVTINHSIDPLPSTWRINWAGRLSQVGQRNITVMETVPGQLNATAFEVASVDPEGGEVTLTLLNREPPARVGDRLLASLALPGLSYTRDRVQAGISDRPEPLDGWETKRAISIRLSPGSTRHLYLLTSADLRVGEFSTWSIVGDYVVCAPRQSGVVVPRGLSNGQA